MKYLCYFLLFLSFLSCSKKKDNPIPVLNTSGTIQYKVNGQLIVMDNANILNGEGVVVAKQLKSSILSATRYLLNAQKGTDNVILTTLITDSLQQINYHYDSAYNAANSGLFQFTLESNGAISSLYYSGDFLDVNITSYANSKVSGTFSAKISPLSNYETRGSVLITEGVLNSIPVTY